MADNQLSKTLGGIRLTSAFQTVYTASSTGDGKQATGQLVVAPLDSQNTIYVDVVVYDGSNYLPVLENMALSRGQAEVIPLSLADGQSVHVRTRSDITALTVSGATAANPVVLTVDSTTGLNQTSDNLVHITGIGGMTEITAGLYRVTYLTATTVSLQDQLGVDVDGSLYTAYTSGGTVTIAPAVATFQAFEETIPQA